MVSSGGLSRPLLGYGLTATSQLRRSVYEPVGLSTFVVARTRPCAYQRPRPVCVCALREQCESTHTYRSGRQAVVSAGRRSLAAVAVPSRRCLSPSRYVAGAVVAVIRQSVVVAAFYSLVAAVSVLLAFRHRLCASSHPRRVASLGVARSQPVAAPTGRRGFTAGASANAPLNSQRSCPSMCDGEDQLRFAQRLRNGPPVLVCD
jgi:hypothetical protein